MRQRRTSLPELRGRQMNTDSFFVENIHRPDEIRAKKISLGRLGRRRSLPPASPSCRLYALRAGSHREGLRPGGRAQRKKIFLKLGALLV